MNILMITDTYKPTINGVPYAVDWVSNSLRNRGHHVTIVSPECATPYTEQNNLRLRSIAYKEHHIFLPLPRKTIRQIHTTHWDIIHTHTPFSAGLLGRWLRKKNNVPKIMTYHTYFDKYLRYIPLPEQFRQRVHMSYGKYIFDACDSIIIPSVDMEKVARNYGYKRSIHVLPTPIDPNAFTSTGDTSPYLKRLGLPKNTSICLSVGRVVAEKNLLFLLKAFKRIHELKPNTHLVMIGDGEMKQELITLAKDWGLKDHISFLGFLPRIDLATWYRFADLFLCSSISETQGLTVYEALHFGLPAVIVDGPGVRHAVTDNVNGFVTPHDEDTYARTVVALLDDEKLLAAFGSNTRINFSGLDEQTIVDRLLSIYEATRCEYYSNDISSNNHITYQ